MPYCRKYRAPRSVSPFTDQLLCTALCLSTHILMFARTHFTVYVLHLQGASVQVQFLHNTSHGYGHSLALCSKIVVCITNVPVQVSLKFLDWTWVK